jgi:hypothetical protein
MLQRVTFRIMTDTMSQKTSAPTIGYQVVVHPSAIVRPVPSFVFAAPPGWVVDEAPGAVCVVRATEPVNEFWNNALLTHDRVAKAVDLQAAASASWGRLKADAPSAATVMERVAKLGQYFVYRRRAAPPAPQSGKKLAQIHAMFFAPSLEDAKTVDLFQFVATSTADQMDTVGKSFVEMVATFRFV